MGNVNLKIDIDKRQMSKYYNQLSTLYFDEKKQEINLKNVTRLTDPPTNSRFKKLVQKGLLKNVYYVHDAANFKLKKDQEEYIN